MHAAVKIIIGLILILIGLGLFVDSVYPLLGTTSLVPGIDWLANFIVVLTGVIPILLILLGLFVVWLEADELKTAKEFEEPKGKKPEKK
ncbi:MAG: hypothetical protein V3U72_04185 [Candidatus Aenigmarchaeota archaeon]